MGEKDKVDSGSVYHDFQNETLNYLDSVREVDSKLADDISNTASCSVGYLNNYFGQIGLDSRISPDSCDQLFLINAEDLLGIKNKEDRTVLEKYSQLQFIDQRDGIKKTFVIIRDYFSLLDDTLKEVVGAVNEDWTDNFDVNFLYNRWSLSRLAIWGLIDTVRSSGVGGELSSYISGWLSTEILENGMEDEQLCLTDRYLRDAFFKYGFISGLIMDEELGQDALRLFLGEKLESPENEERIRKYIF